MLCAISGAPAAEPVASARSGHVFEARALRKALADSGGRCPVTGEALAEADLVPLKAPPGIRCVEPAPAVRPRPRPRPRPRRGPTGRGPARQPDGTAPPLPPHAIAAPTLLPSCCSA